MSIEEEKYVEAESRLMNAISGFYEAARGMGLDLDQISSDIKNAVYRGTEGTINFED